MMILRSLEGAAKCALRDLRREDETAAVHNETVRISIEEGKFENEIHNSNQLKLSCSM